MDDGLKTLPFFALGSRSHASSMKCMYCKVASRGLAFAICVKTVLMVACFANTVASSARTETNASKNGGKK